MLTNTKDDIFFCVVKSNLANIYPLVCWSQR